MADRENPKKIPEKNRSQFDQRPCQNQYKSKTDEYDAVGQIQEPGFEK